MQKRVAMGVRRELIAKELGITLPTLAKHYGAQLEDGVALYRQKLIDKLEEEGFAGKVSALKALYTLTVPQTSKAPEEERSAGKTSAAGNLKLGKKEQAQLAADQANVGAFATPAPPPGLKH